MDTLSAIFSPSDAGGTLSAPKLGVFTAQISTGDLVRPGVLLGTLRVLNRRYRVIAPAGAAGVVERLPDERHHAVGYGEALIALGALGEGLASVRGVAAAAGASDEAIDGTAVTAPITGIFYRRAGPTSPVYVEIGQAVSTGQTVGLIEVMKTFNPVLYTGAPGVVVAIPATDRQEVAAGQALVVVRAG